MKTITIYTQSHEQALRTCIQNGIRLTVRYEGMRDGMFYLNCAYENPPPADTLLTLLEHVALQENPIYRHSPKLTALAQEWRSTPAYEDNLTRLRLYLKENRTLHLEGYVFFRMADYRRRLDELMFSLIKKLKLTEQ